MGLKDALADHPNVGDIRGLGLMCGVEVVKDRATKAPFGPEDGIGPRLMKAMISRKLFTRLKGEDVICLAPPIMVSNEILDDVVAIVRDSVHEVFGGGRKAEARNGRRVAGAPTPWCVVTATLPGSRRSAKP